MGAAVRIRGVTAGLLLVAAGCIGTSPSSTQGEPTGSSTSPVETPADTPSPAIPSPDPEVATVLASLPGRLLIRSDELGLATTRPDGGDVRRLTQDAEVLDAAWSPDGRRVAWTEVARNADLADLVVAAPRGADRRAVAIGFAPFFLSWDPTAMRIGLLGNGAASLRLAVADVGGGAAGVADVAQGSPFYFSWAPAGDRLLANRDGGGIEQLGLDGTARRLDERTGVYQAPVWSPDGATAYYVRTRQGLAQELVARPTGAGAPTVLTVQRGAIFFVASPDGSRIALHAREPSELDFSDPSLPSRATDLGVTVVDTRTGELTRVSDDPAIAWSWSPDGRRLAILEPVYGPDAIVFRWRVTGGGRDIVTDPFVAPLRYLRAVVPFFTQFAQSGTMWSPDGDAIAYPIDTPDGPRIVVRPTAPDATATVVALGDTVTWSPR
ncbi:MAG TPA: hypothetical protein VF235_08670 [Actinomycetota bacterium]